MSQNNAESSEFSVGSGNLMITSGAEEEDIEMKIDPLHASEAAGGSKIVEEGPEIDADCDKDEERRRELARPPQVVLNECVIFEIAKYMNYQDLKSLRHVDKFWPAGATRQFLYKSAIYLNYGKGSGQQMSAFEAETKNLKGISAFKINQSFHGFEKEDQHLRHILAAFAPNLNALELEFWRNDMMSYLGPSIRFPVLISLTIDNKLSMESWRWLYAAAPALRHIVAHNFSPDALSALISEDGARNWALAPNLSSLGLICCPRLVKALFNFPQNWEALALTFIDALDEDDLGALFDLFEKNKDSLIKLKLELHQDTIFPQHPQTLRFPAPFPKLCKLELKFSKLHNAVVFGEDGLRAFSEIFPKLTSLSVKLPNGEENGTEVWRSLFLPQVSRQLKALKFLKVTGMDYVRFRPKKSGKDWARKLFPCARLQIS